VTRIVAAGATLDAPIWEAEGFERQPGEQYFSTYLLNASCSAGELEICILSTEDSRELDCVLEMWSSLPEIHLLDSERDSLLCLISSLNPVILAKDESGIIGAIMVMSHGLYGMLMHLSVIPRLRKTGIGRKLVDAAHAHLIGIGVRYVIAGTTNEATRLFWGSQSIGYEGVSDALYQKDIC
jgi:GNAT superfamily N-acetyltransferase